MAVDNIAIGRRIKAWRSSKGMTQKELAAHINLTQAQMSNIERGITSLTVEVCVQIAESLQCDINYIIFGEERQRITNVDIKTIEKIQKQENLSLTPEEMIKLLKIIRCIQTK